MQILIILAYVLQVEVTGLKSDKGMLMVEMLDKSGKTVAVRKLTIKDKRAIARFDQLAGGEYAIRFFHDENNNGKMDTNWLGIPTESYGFSNEAKGKLGPPPLKDMLFGVYEDKTITIKAIH